ALDTARALAQGGIIWRFGERVAGFDTLPPTDGASRLAPALDAAAARGGPVTVVSDGAIPDLADIPPDLARRARIVPLPRASLFPLPGLFTGRPRVFSRRRLASARSAAGGCRRRPRAPRRRASLRARGEAPAVRRAPGLAAGLGDPVPRAHARGRGPRARADIHRSGARWKPLAGRGDAREPGAERRGAGRSGRRARHRGRRPGDIQPLQPQGSRAALARHAAPRRRLVRATAPFG